MPITKPRLSTNINTDVGTFTDPILVLHQGSTAADIDVGFLMNRSNGLTSNAAVIWQESSKSFVHILTNSSGAADANLVVQSYANVSVGNVLLIANAGIYVDGSLGSPGQVLASDGSKTFWAAPGGFTGGAVPNQTTFASNLVISNTTPSTSNVTGALVVLGGAGIQGNVYANVFYTLDGIRWAGNGAVFASGGGGGGGGNTYTANTAPPTSGNVAGDMWYDTNADILYEYLDDGSTKYWVDVQSLGQTGNIVSMVDTTLSGNIVVGLSNVYSIGTSTGYIRNIFANAITANGITSTGNVVIAATTTSTSTTTGALVVNGGAGIAGNIELGGDLEFNGTGNRIRGDFSNATLANRVAFQTSTTNGATTIMALPNGTGVNSQLLLRSGSTAADDSFGQVVLVGGSEFRIASGSAGTGTNLPMTFYTGGSERVKIDASTGNVVIVPTTTSTSTTTGALVVRGGAGFAANIFTAGWIIPSSNVSQNLGTTTSWWNLIYGRSVQAQYADLAENYLADQQYEPGTAVIFGGVKEITTTDVSHDTRVAGVISTNPGYLMNAAAAGLPVALQGRVPCRVKGPVSQGDLVVTSDIPGVACKLDPFKFEHGCLIGKSLESIDDESIRTIEVVVGRY